MLGAGDNRLVLFKREENMAKVKNIEKRIWHIAGFDVCILHSDERDARGDLSGLPQFPTYERASKNSATVENWKENRFKPKYPGFDVAVLDGDGNRCGGKESSVEVRRERGHYGHYDRMVYTGCSNSDIHLKPCRGIYFI
jgi:hypothetical protein